MNRNKTMMINHVKEHVTIYVFMIVLLLTGIIFGAIIVNSMSFVQKQDLFFQLDRYFNLLNGEDTIYNKDVLKRSFFFHMKYLLLFFILGLTIIGLPVVWLLTFVKGLVIGFSVGFMVNQLGFKGLLLATLSIAPQNILILPIYIVAASLAMIFSLSLLYKLFGRTYNQSIGKPFLQYIMMFGILHVGALGSSIIETFVANEALKSVVKTSYHIIMNIMFI